MIGRFDGKVVLIVGASVGIGAAAGRLFSDLDAAVLLASRNMLDQRSRPTDDGLSRPCRGQAVTVPTDAQPQRRHRGSR